jgi:hypothetical protein
VNEERPDFEPTETQPEPAPARRRNGPRAAIAAALAVVLVAAGIWIVSATGDDDEGKPRPLALMGANDEAASVARDAVYRAQPIEYTLEGQLPDLGSTGVVYKLVAPSNAHDAAARIADVLGVDGEVRDIEGGAEVVGDNYTVNVYDAGGLQISVYRSTESGGSGSSSSASGSSGTPGTGSLAVPPDAPTSSDVAEDQKAREQAAPTTIPYTPPVPPKNLPTAAEAEQIARDLLGRMGLLEGAEWDAQVSDSGVAGISRGCGPTENCLLPDAEQTFVTSRAVTLSPKVDGQRVSGLAWYVEVGDEGVVTSINGTSARFERVDDYPLRPIQEVLNDLESGKWSEVMPLGPGTAVARDDIAVAPPETATPIRVTVTGAHLGTMLSSGMENDKVTTYAVPSYRFTGKYETGEPWEAELMALAPEYVTTPSTTVPPDEPKPEPAPVTVPEPPATSTPDTTPPKGTGTLELYVSNQSFNIDPVDIVVSLDGKEIIAQDFDVEGQHNWVRFNIDVPTGSHKLAVTANGGSAQRDLPIEIGTSTLFGVINFWAECGEQPTGIDRCDVEPKIEITLQDTPPAFA